MHLIQSCRPDMLDNGHRAKVQVNKWLCVIGRLAMIADDNELKQAVAIVDEHIQQIQDYLGQTTHADGKIRFPRNFIRTASHFRERLSFIKDANIRDNLAYALIQSDVYRWLTNRTDIFGTAKEMIIKSGIALMGSICETMAIDSTKGIIGRRHSFCDRCTRMVTKRMISEDVKNELHWLWDARAAIHIYEIDHREYEKYQMKDYNRATKATIELRNALNNFLS